MIKYSVKNTSPFCVIIGIMLLIVGFNGLMAYNYSVVTEHIGDVRVAKISECKKMLAEHEKLCVISNIYSDDAFFMPDTQQKVVEGSIFIAAIWPDGSRNVLLDWHKRSKFLKIYNSDSSTLYINPKDIESDIDTSSVKKKLSVKIKGNDVDVTYCGYKFKFSGNTIKGTPRIKLIRKVLTVGDEVVLTLSKSQVRSKNDDTFAVTGLTTLKNAMQNEIKDSYSTKIYIFIIVVGVVMFFIPEHKNINPFAARNKKTR